MLLEEPLAFPGLTFAERPNLFASLVGTPVNNKDHIPVTLGTRSAVLLLNPIAVREVLRSSSPKGRPIDGLQRVGGYVGLQGRGFRTMRADVLAALRKASRDIPHSLSTSFLSGDSSFVAPALMANLLGTEMDEELVGLTARTRSIMRSLVEHSGDASSAAQLLSVRRQLKRLLSTNSAFVRELVCRGWELREIAAEITTLTFAGWASLAAAIRSGVTVGVAGAIATEQAITEVLRLAPPGWLITREPGEQFSPTYDNSGSAGRLLVMSPWLLHRAPGYWSQPAEFNEKRAGTRSSVAYLPFSAGLRSCPAEAYSRAFLRTSLAALPACSPSTVVQPALIDERSACLLPMEGRTP